MASPTASVLLPNITITPATVPGNTERILALKQSLRVLRTTEGLKRTSTSKLRDHADLIYATLDALKGIDPMVKLAIIPFQVTMMIITSKNDNDQRAGALLVEMIDMMTPLLDLDELVSTKRTSDIPTGESNLTGALKAIERDIKLAGNTVDKYYKAGKWNRVLKLSSWSDAFTRHASQFRRNKSQIQLALGIRTAASVDAMSRKLDEIAEIMKDRFLTPPPEDKRLSEFIMKKQNKLELPNKDEFKKLHIAYESQVSEREQPGRTGDRRMGEKRGVPQEQMSNAIEEWDALQKSLEEILEENRSTFDAMLKSVKITLGSEIQLAEKNIIKKLTDGPHQYIHHPELQNLWKLMDWRVSVKTRHFVVALHDHYLHDLNLSRALDRETPATPTRPSAPVTINQDDKWCLRYLNIRYLPSISEAFDDDGSGFIKVSEVNGFTDGIPEGWSLLKWIAYWNGAWPTETWTYARLIRRTLSNISDAQMNVRRENLEPVQNYMNAVALSQIQTIVQTVLDNLQPKSMEPEVYHLGEDYMKQRDEALKKTLKTTGYHIDLPGSLPLLFGPGRVEKYLFPLLHVLLSHHLEIIQFAKLVILDDRELSVAENSLENVFNKVEERVNELQESFRQQKLDVNEQFKSFSCGMYSRFQYARYYNLRVGSAFEYKWYDTELEDNGSSDEDDYEDEEPSSKFLDTESASLVQPEPSNLPPPIAVESPDATGIKPPTNGIDERTLSDPSSPIHGSVLTVESQSDANATPTGDCPPNHSKHYDVTSQQARCAKDPTLFGPFATRFYAEPLTLPTDETLTPFHLSFGTTRPSGLELFRLAADRVLERIQLTSPRLTWNYLQRRRSIRLQWVEIALRFEDVGSTDEDSVDEVNAGEDNEDEDEAVEDTGVENREPSNDEMLQSLISYHHISTTDISFYGSLVNLYSRIRSVHSYYYCDGCRSRVTGKRFYCMDCNNFDLCNDCEYAEPPKHNTVQHPASHTMILLQFFTLNIPALQAFQYRAERYMAEHAKSCCPCSSLEGRSASIETGGVLHCYGCKKAIRNMVHFRCLQCLDCDLCEDCERNGSSDHCLSHAMIKVKVPFEDFGELSDTDDLNHEGFPLDVGAKLSRMREHAKSMNMSYRNRLDEMQTKFSADLNELRGEFTEKLDQVIVLLEKTRTPQQMSSTEHKYCILAGSRHG